MSIVYRQNAGNERKVRFIPVTPELLYQFFALLKAANVSADIEYIEFLTKKKWTTN